jgi:hypothetical protein
MDRSTFEAADPVVDEIAEKLDELLNSDHFAAVRLLLARPGEKVGPRYSANLNLARSVTSADKTMWCRTLQLIEGAAQ